MQVRVVFIAVALVLGCVSLQLSAQAPSSGSKKLYKWTDKDGGVHYSDQIPPEAKEYARERLSDQGVAVERTDRAMTPEELAAQKAAQDKAEADARQAEEIRKSDEALINSYASEEDLTRAYQQRLDLLGQTIEARHIEIAAREQSLQTLVAQAAEMERGGRAVSDALKQMIASERVEIDRQKAFLVKKEAEKITAKTDYDRDMARYKSALARSQKDQ